MNSFIALCTITFCSLSSIAQESAFELLFDSKAVKADGQMILQTYRSAESRPDQYAFSGNFSNKHDEHIVMGEVVFDDSVRVTQTVKDEWNQLLSLRDFEGRESTIDILQFADTVVLSSSTIYIPKSLDVRLPSSMALGERVEWDADPKDTRGVVIELRNQRVLAYTKEVRTIKTDATTGYYELTQEDLDFVKDYSQVHVTVLHGAMTEGKIKKPRLNWVLIYLESFGGVVDNMSNE